MTRITIKLTAIACLLLCVSACTQVAISENARTRDRGLRRATSGDSSARSSDTYGRPTRLGLLGYKEINESSGIVSSRTNPGLYWTHNDSGDGPFVYAIDAKGTHKGVWRVTGATARDWEDIAIGPGPERGTNYLYIGDTGDNRGARAEIRIYRVAEPKITSGDANSTKVAPVATKDAEIIRLRYPNGANDAETLLIHPQSGNVYIVTKVPLGNPVVYEAKAPLNTRETTTLVRVGEVSLPVLFGGLITGGDISPDGLRVALCDYQQGYELELPAAGAGFNAVWKQTVTVVELGERKQGEAIGYRLDGRALLATSEGRRAPLIQVVRR
ncbi:MAG TPA: hypothetical protein VNO50_10665 [Pyrinomonadaceae bacterium]|nr:hypothetical protein [Pyrinomonadaceae bacterium]